MCNREVSQEASDLISGVPSNGVMREVTLLKEVYVVQALHEFRALVYGIFRCWLGTKTQFRELFVRCNRKNASFEIRNRASVECSHP